MREVLLLPGGGVEGLESDEEAIMRELQEELGATVKHILPIGVVVQYRTHLGRRYIVRGYTAELDSANGPKNPQNAGDANFVE